DTQWALIHCMTEPRGTGICSSANKCDKRWIILMNTFKPFGCMLFKLHFFYSFSRLRIHADRVLQNGKRMVHFFCCLVLSRSSSQREVSACNTMGLFCNRTA